MLVNSQCGRILTSNSITTDSAVFINSPNAPSSMLYNLLHVGRGLLNIYHILTVIYSNSQLIKQHDHKSVNVEISNDLDFVLVPGIS